MKKIISLILAIFIANSILFCPIAVAAVPVPTPVIPSDPGGLDGGAVTGIVLGSIGVLVLGSLVYCFCKNKCVTETCCNACPCPCIDPICLDKCSYLAKLNKQPAKNKQLIRAVSNSEIQSGDKAVYIIQKDTTITNLDSQRLCFRLPDFNCEKPLNIKVTRTSDPYSVSENIPELDTKILLETGEDNQYIELPMSTKIIDESNGIFEKKGQLTTNQYTKAWLVTSYNSIDANALPKNFAVLVELEY